MLNVTLICPGKLKESYLREAVDEYVKRLGAYCKLNIITLTPERLDDSPSELLIKAALEKEAAAILSKIPQNAFVIALCVEGKMLSSEELSEKLSGVPLSGKSDVYFIIGSSYGLSPGIKERADLRLSFSKMTFPHQLMRVMLLEQLYRAFQISAGGKYHK